MDHHASGFVDHQDMLVFKNDSKRNIFLLKRLLLRLDLHLHHHSLATPYLGLRSAGQPCHRDQAFFNPRLQPRSGMLRQQTLQCYVQAQTTQVVWNSQR